MEEIIFELGVRSKYLGESLRTKPASNIRWQIGRMFIRVGDRLIDYVTLGYYEIIYKKKNRTWRRTYNSTHYF